LHKINGSKFSKNDFRPVRFAPGNTKMTFVITFLMDKFVQLKYVEVVPLFQSGFSSTFFALVVRGLVVNATELGAACSRCQHATRRPSLVGTIGGLVVRHCSSAKGQRGLKRQPTIDESALPA